MPNLDYKQDNQNDNLYIEAKSLFNKGDFNNAKNLLEKSNLIHSNPALYWNEIGECLINLDHEEEALKAYYKSIEYSNQLPKPFINLGYIYIKRKMYQEAIHLLNKAYELTPNDPDVNFAICIAVFNSSKDLSSLKKHINNAAQIKGLNKIHAHHIASIFYKTQRNYNKTLYHLEEIFKIDPNSYEALISLAEIYSYQAKIDQSIEILKESIKINPTCKKAYDNILVYMHYSMNISPEENLKIAKQYYDNCYSLIPETQKKLYLKRGIAKKTKLKIGFVSGDFRLHSVFFWIVDLFKLIDKNKFELFCYCNNPEDKYSEQLKDGVSKWTNILYENDLNVANMILNDGIDILIDLSGHTGLNRLGIFVHKPAPVQISWLGQSGPMGLPEIDYIFSDKYMFKDNESAYYTEKIYKLPDSFAAYNSKLFQEIEITDTPCLKNNFITFASFNNFIKINETVLNTWSQILNKVKDSKLLIQNHSVKDISYRENLIKYFRDSGIDESRIILKEQVSKEEYIKTYNEIDVCLDTFPINGATTSHETLLMSTPLISLTGSKMPHRGGLSILMNSGLGELVANNINDYINIAVNLANNPQKIQEYKKSIRKKYLESPISNMKIFTQGLEQAFFDVWDSFQTSSS